MRPQNLGDVINREAPVEAIWLTAISPDGAARRITFGEFRRTTDAMARGLLKRGLVRGARVGILAANSAEFLLAFYGILRAGMTAVPVNWKLPADTVAHIVRDASIELMFVDAEREALAGSAARTRLDDAAAWNELLDPGPHAVADMRDEEIALILYTSGSTGLPKGVPLTHGGYVWAVRQLVEKGPPAAGRKMLIAAPLYHMNGLLQGTIMGAAGGSVVMLCRFTPLAYLEAAARERCEYVTVIPTMLALVARERDAIARLDLTGTELVVSGSAPASETLFAEAARIFPKARVMNTWGTTEGSPVVFGPHPLGVPRPGLSVGYPLDVGDIRLEGGDDEGVLWVRNRAVMPGYLNRPEETARRLHDGWYDTGDILRRDAEGFYYFVGRADDMFTCGGENVWPGEVESLLERHPDVAQAAVVPIDDPVKHRVPVAFVVPRPGTQPQPEAIKQFALAHGPAYLHPRFVEIVAALPLAGTNKVDRRALSERAARSFSR